MSTSITTTPEYTASEPSRPQDGDDAFFDGGVAPLWPILQLALNRTHFARGGVWGALRWNAKMAVSGTAAAPVVVVGPIDSAALADGNNVWRPYFTSGETTLGASHVEGGGSLSTSTFYYVYAWSDSAAPANVKFQISTSPPTTNGTPTVRTGYKRGETKNFRYLGCFPTDGSGNPIPLRMVNGIYRYDFDSLSVSAPHRLLNAADSASPTWTAVSAAAVVPPHCRNARLHCVLATAGSTTPGGSAFLRQTGTTANNRSWTFYAVGSHTFETETELNTSQQFDFSTNPLDTTAKLSAWVLGFQE